MIDGEGIAKSDWSNVIRYEVEEPTTDPDHEPEPEPDPQIYRYSIANAPRA